MQCNQPIRRRLATTVVLGMILAGCGVKARPPLQAGGENLPQPTGYNSFAPEDEVKIGQEVAQQADAQLPELPADNDVSAYVRTIGNRLASHLPQNPYQFNFKVVQEKDI